MSDPESGSDEWKRGTGSVYVRWDVSELRTQETNKPCWPLLAQTLCLLGHLHLSLESRQSLAKQSALLGKRHRLVHGGAKAEKLA